MAFVIPVGVDWADGATVLRVQPDGASGSPTIIGTPIPTANIQMYYGNGTLSDLIQEESGSPEIERSEQCTCRHELKLPYVTGLSYWGVMGRGTMVTDTAGNVWRILSCNCKRLNEPCVYQGYSGVFCTFSYVAESISFDSPPDDFEIQEVSLDLDIIKHPRYAWAISPYVTDVSLYATVGDTNITYRDIKETIMRMIQTYIESPFFPSATMINGLVQSTIMTQVKPGPDGKYHIDVQYPNPNYVSINGKSPATPVNWDGTTTALTGMPNCQFFIISVPFTNTETNPVVIAIAAAYELITKLWRKEDTPYIASYKIVWTQKVFQTVYLNPGGYIEDPRQIVPQYFMNPFNNGIIPRSYWVDGQAVDSSVTNPNGSIFDLLPIINPQCYSVTGVRGGPLSFSCLRISDTIRYDRTFFDVPHTWLCSVVGKWDEDLYTQGDRPKNANEFNVLPNT